MNQLDSYPFCGHGVLMGNYRNEWQDTDYILARFGKRVSATRSRYRQFVEKETGKRRKTVRARSLLCYRAAGELRMSMTGLSALLKISVNCVSQSVARGKILAKMNGYSLVEYKD